MSIIICYIIIYILEALILRQYCRNLFISKYAGKWEILSLFLCYFILFIGSFQESFAVNLFLFFFGNFFFIWGIYDLKCLTAFFHSLLITMIMVLSELGILSIISYFAPDFYNNITYFRNLVILTITSKLLYFLILQSISLYMRHAKDKELSPSKSSLFLNIIPLISGFIAVVLASICMNVKLSLFLDILISISAVLLLSVNIFLAWFYSYIQEKNNAFVEMQILLQKEHETTLYYDTLQKHDEKQKILIHDIRNHLYSIAALNERGETERISSYIDRIIQSSELQDAVRVCDNDLLNTIIFRIQQKCNENGTSFKTDIRSGSVDFLSEYDMTRLFSNLFTNAVEATSAIADSFIELNITPHSNENNIIITMVNSCKKDPFSSNHNKLITTKGDKWRHGYGMKSVQRVIEKYNGNSQLYFDKETSTFHTTILLSKNMAGSVTVP